MTAPVARGREAVYRHGPAIEERFEVGPEGVQLSWHFGAPLPGHGDLVVRYALATNLPAPTPDGDGLRFLGAHGGVRVGGVTGIDARGNRTAGSLRCRDGALELVLPGTFVDHAAYPLVLDPLLGTVLPIASGLTFAEGNPDVEFVRSPNNLGYLVVWERALSATNVVIRGQRVGYTGNPTGGVIFFGSTGVARAPRVAALLTNDSFGVIWTQQASGIGSVEFAVVNATSGAIVFTHTIASAAGGDFPSAAIGCETSGGSGHGFFAVYEDDVTAAIRGASITWAALPGWVVSAAGALWTDALLGASYHTPAIARRADADHRLLVVAHKSPGLLGSYEIVGRAVDTQGNLISPTVALASSSANDLANPAVDGYADRWVVAWEHLAGGSADAVRVAPVQWGVAGNTLTVGAVTTFGGTLFVRAAAPTVCYAPSRTWIGFQQIAALPTPTTTLRLAAVDTNSCASCSEQFLVSNPSGPRIVAARTAGAATGSGPNPGFDDQALGVYDDSFDDVAGQRLVDHGTTGTTTSLGGGCGASGTGGPLGAPTIGSVYREQRGFLPAGVLFAIFNLAPTGGAPLPCGPCQWTPFSATVNVPVPAPSAALAVEFVIPCVPALVGQQFERQWTFLDPTQTPCPVFPGLLLSERTLLTIGQ